MKDEPAQSILQWTDFLKLVGQSFKKGLAEGLNEHAAKVTTETPPTTTSANSAEPQAGCVVPDKYINGYRIGLMALGDAGYVRPEAIRLDNRRRAWVDPTFAVSKQSTARSSVRIMRISNGFHIWPGDERWLPSERKFDHTNRPYMPIVAID